MVESSYQKLAGEVRSTPIYHSIDFQESNAKVFDKLHEAQQIKHPRRTELIQWAAFLLIGMFVGSLAFLIVFLEDYSMAAKIFAG